MIEIKTNIVANKRKTGLKDFLTSWQLYILLLPAIIYIFVFNYVPMYGIIIAFKDYSAGLGIWASKWAGLEHFKRFFSNPMCLTIIKNTITLSLYSLIAGFPLPIVFALGLNYLDNKKFKKLAQNISYAPHFVSTVVIVGMLMIFLSPHNGFVNGLIQAFGGEKIFFFGEKNWFPHLHVWSGIWQNVGWNSIIYLAALSGVDPSLHESATMDGASRIKRIWHIDLPCILPTISILLILNVGNIMNVGFEKVFLMQNSLNADTSEIISTYVYKSGLVGAQFSYSTAVELFNSIINFVLLLIVNTSSKAISGNGLW